MTRPIPVCAQRLAALVTIATIASACNDVAPLPLPPNHAARAVILVLGDGPRALAARAIDPAAGDWIPLAGREGHTLYAVSFSCPLERLGLTAGLQALADSASDIELMPPPAATFEATLGGTASIDWQPRAELPRAVDDALRRLPVPRDARCQAVGARYRADALRMPAEELGPPAFAIALDDHRVLAGTRADYLFEVTRDGVTRLQRHEGRSFRGGMRARDGTLWMVDLQGAVWHGTLETEFTVVTSSAPFGGFKQRIAVAGPSDDSPFEMFAEAEAESGDGREFYRFDGTRWTRLAAFTPERNTIYFPALAWIGPQQAVSIGTFPRAAGGVMRYDRGALIPQDLRGMSPNSSILHHPTLGTLVGHDQDGLDRFDGRRWDTFDGALPLIYIRVMAAEGDGLLYVGSTEINFSPSAFAQYHPSIGFCRTYDTFTDFAVTHMAPLGDDARVALTVADFQAAMGVTILTRTHAAASCSTP